MKPSTAKAKGRATENQAVEWLISVGFDQAERRRLQGVEDQGDIAGIAGVCIEVKSAATWKPMQWLRELVAEKRNSRAHTAFVMARPKGGTDVWDWPIIITPAQLLEFLGMSAEEVELLRQGQHDDPEQDRGSHDDVDVGAG